MTTWRGVVVAACCGAVAVAFPWTLAARDGSAQPWTMNSFAVSEWLVRRALVTLAVLCLASAARSPAVEARQTRGALEPGTWAITNVHVVPMTSDTVLEDAVVIVRDGRIASVEAAGSASLDAEIRTVDAGGGWLVPGLSDMHTHLYSDYDLPDSAAPAELGVMLANGVTTIRLMAGTPEQLELREAVRRAVVPGPQIWAASPMFADEAGSNTRVITWPEDGRAAVREVAAAGYDFVKITFGIVGNTYDAIVDEASRVGIGVVGHVEPEVGVARAVAAGQQLEHLDAYFEGALADSAAGQPSLTQFGVYSAENWSSLDHLDEANLQALAELTAASGVWVGPTLEVFNRAFGDPLTDEQLHALPDWQFIPRSMRDGYARSREAYWAQPVPREKRERYAEVRSHLVKMIHDAGGRLIAGSDTPDLLMAHGFTLHRELQAMVDAGLSPYHALETATRNPAEYLGRLDDFGTIEPGRRADLVLLAGNPLENIANTTRIRAVAVGGRWLTRSELDAMLERGRRAIADGGGG